MELHRPISSPATHSAIASSRVSFSDSCGIPTKWHLIRPNERKKSMKRYISGLLRRRYFQSSASTHFNLHLAAILLTLSRPVQINQPTSRPFVAWKYALSVLRLIWRPWSRSWSGGLALRISQHGLLGRIGFGAGFDSHGWEVSACFGELGSFGLMLEVCGGGRHLCVGGVVGFMLRAVRWRFQDLLICRLKERNHDLESRDARRGCRHFISKS